MARVTRDVCRVFAAAVATVLGATTAAAQSRTPHTERQEAVFPERTADIIGTASGTALLLGEDSPKLYEVSAGGTHEVAHPDVGTLLSIGDESWILGRDALLHRRDGTWHRVELPTLPDVVDPYRTSHVVPLDGSRVVVVRAYGQPQDVKKPTTGGTKIDLVDAGGAATELLTLPEMILSRPVADGAGGFWTIVRKRGFPSSDSYGGYAHFANGKWTLWRLAGPKVSSYVTELPPMRIHDMTEWALLDELAPAPDGGVIGRWGARLYRIQANGGLSILRDVNAQHLCAMARMPSTSSYALLSTTGLSHIYVSVMDANGNVVGPTEIELPAWYRGKFRPPVYYCKASAMPDGNMWISSGPFVVERSASGAVTTYVASQIIEEARETDARQKPSLAAITLPPLAITGLGIVGGAQLGDVGYGTATAQTLSATVAGLPAALLLDVLDDNPCIKGNDSGYQILNDMACGVRAMGYVVAVTGGGGLGALGTVLATRALGETVPTGDEARDVALASWLGGSLGSVVSIGTTKLMRRHVPQAGRLARSILAATLIGAGSTIGYHLAR